MKTAWLRLRLAMSEAKIERWRHMTPEEQRHDDMDERKVLAFVWFVFFALLTLCCGGLAYEGSMTTQILLLYIMMLALTILGFVSFSRDHQAHAHSCPICAVRQ